MLLLGIFKKFLYVLSTLCIVLSTYEIYAATNLFTSIAFEQEYNDNIFFTRGIEIDDFITHVIPTIRLNHNTELSDFSALARWDSLFYWDNEDLNTTNQNYVLKGKHRLTERFSVSGDAGYIKDTTLDSQLEETGVVGIRQERERIDAGAGTEYMISERSSLGFDYDYRKINYERESSVDNEVHGFGLVYKRFLSNQVDILSVYPEFTYGTSDQWDAYNYTLNFSFSRQFSPTLGGYFLIGVRNTQINFKDERDDSSDWGGIVDAWIQKNGEATVGRLGFNNRLATRENGDIINVARLLANVDHRLTERFGVGFGGGLYYTRPLKGVEPEEDDIWYFTLSPSLFYRLTEDHILRLLYSYDQEIRPELDESRKDRQRIWLRLDFNFPHTWERLFS